VSRPIDPRLLRAVPAMRRLVVSLTAVQIVGAVLTVVQAGLLAELVVSIFLRHQYGQPLVGRLALLAAVGIGRAGMSSLQEWFSARASTKVRADLRALVLDAIVRMGPTAAARQESGRLTTAAGAGLESLDGYLTRAMPALIGAAVVPPVVLLRIGLADWQSAALFLVVLPLVPLFMALIGIMTRRRMERQYATLARMSGHFLDLVRGLTTLRIYGQATRQVETVRRATETYRRHTMATLRTAFLSGLVLDLLATLSVAIVAVDVGLRLDHANLDLTTALVVLFLAPEVFAPLRAMGTQHHASEEGRVAMAAAFDVIAEADRVDDGAALQTEGVASTTGDIDLRSVRLRYPGRADAALDDLCLSIGAGEVVVLQGRSGGGKSSVLACLLGFVRPESGSIAVGADGGTVELTALDAAAWREQVAWVPQRPHLTQPTVGAEVALGDPTASADRIADAIDLCCAPPARTPLGEGAIAVSAGQRRRVALARALVRVWRQRELGAVPILLLDEPSEDLDARTEQVVASVISGLAGRATVIIASHSERLATVADRRVVIDAGRVVDDCPQHRVEIAGPVFEAGAESEDAVTQSAQRRIVAGTRDALGLRGIRRWLIGAGALSGAAGIAGLALTATSVWLICRAAQHPNVQALALAVVGVRTFALARALLRYAERLVSHDSALRLLAHVRARVFAAIAPLVPSGLGDLRRGDLLRRFVSDVDGIQEGLVRALVPFTGAVITTAAAITLAAVLSPLAGVVLAGAVLVGLVLAPVVSHAVAGPAAELTRLAGARDATTNNLLDGLDELTAFAAEGRTVADIERLDRQVVDAARRPAIGAALGVGLTGLASALALPLALSAGGTAVRSGSLDAVSVGVLVACVLAAFDALAPLPSAFAAWSRFRAGLDRATDLLARPVPMRAPSVPIDVPYGATGIRGAAVTLAPALGAPAVLRDADLRLCPGERVAVIGPSGSGKSTLLAAALRLTPVAGGRLNLRRDRTAVPIDELQAEDMPPLVAGSLQGDHVFDASMRDNLRVVRPEATDDDLDAVAARAGLTDFIAELPLGWSTPAGADGAALSGGQRQRLLLARALLADPEVLILDEPTAHLDPETERAVLADLLDVTRGRTVLMSTHRRLAEDQIDRVLRIEDQQLVAV